MDDMSMVRRLLAESPPHPHVVAEGRERLFGSPARGTRATRTIRRAAFRSAVGLGLTGVAAAAALAVATLVPGAGTSPGGGNPPATEVSARKVLLAAATRAESVPTSGTYWHVRRMSTTTFPRKLGRGENRYTVELQSVIEEWTKRSGETWWGSREWVMPKSPEDEAAWRRDGSPSKWCMGETDTEPPQPSCLHTSPGEASLMRVGVDTFVIADETELTFEQLQQLPAEADALRAWVVDAVKHDLDPSASGKIVDYNVASVLANLLVDVPVPPDVRAAAYRALADMPNVTSIGPTHDELGRAGTGILIDPGDRARLVGRGGRTFEAGEFNRMLIIDPDTSHVLADQVSVDKNITPIGSTLILEVGWTDEKPHEPALP
jgi:hypothetical protein